MANYILLGRYTSQGSAAMRQFADQDEAAELFRARGIELKGLYLTMGQYDLMAIIEAPSDTAIAAFLIDIAGQGFISTETLRAFSSSEVRALVS